MFATATALAKDVWMLATLQELKANSAVYAAMATLASSKGF